MRPNQRAALGDERTRYCHLPITDPARVSTNVKRLTHMVISATSKTFSKDFLRVVLPDDHDGIDIEDPYQCCAYLWLCFECSDCGRQELYEEVAADYPSRAWV